MTDRTSYGLTRMQRLCLDFIKSYMLENDNVPPSFQEITDGIGLHSKSGTSRLVKALEQRGLIRRLSNRARAIQVVEDNAITLMLPAELDHRVRLVATSSGVSPEKYITDILRSRLSISSERAPDPLQRVAMR